MDLYNAINGTEYTNPDDLEINTLENVLYMTMKNDVSFMIGCTMNLYEHQSFYNPNMPLRGFLYLAKLYNKYVNQRKLNLYSSTLQRIPTPRFIVFYNGLQEEPDRKILKLSDAFLKEDGCLECEAVMLNINRGRNRDLMEKCRRLEEYSIFVDTVRKYSLKEYLNLEDAITLAIDECIEKGVLADILIKQRAEVFMFVLETFDKELYERDLKEYLLAQGLEEGRVKGLAEGRAEGQVLKLKEQIRRKLQKNLSVEKIADALEEDAETIKKLIDELEAE